MVRKSTEIRQEEIKRAVLEIIQNDGLKFLSTKNLAKQTGISEGAIFRHFKTKRDIILSIINDVLSDLIENLRQISLSDTPPQERLFNYLCKTISYLTENNGITILLFSEASHNNDEEMMKKLSHIFNSQRKFAGKIISDGITQGIWDESVSVEDVTILYMGIPITLNIELILSQGKFHKDDFCHKMMLLLERILKKN
jgi:AcrR family transcriptional regulator